MTRKGKIARLPAAIRAQLNQRLLDGGPARKIVEWLNRLPKVQAVLKNLFEGRPMTVDNLSEWKNGGYLVWASGRKTWEAVCSFMDGTADLQDAAKAGLTDRMALMLAATMAVQMQKLQNKPESVEKAKIWRELRLGLLALRRSELYAQRLKIEARKNPLLKKSKKDQDLSPEERAQRITDIIGLYEGFDGSKNPELTRPPDDENRANSEQIGATGSKSEK